MDGVGLVQPAIINKFFTRTMPPRGGVRMNRRGHHSLPAIKTTVDE